MGLVSGPDETLAAYPMGKGSGSVTTFSHADGFITIDRHQEILEENAPVQVTLLGGQLQVADLVVIGSHCVGLDLILSELQQSGCRNKSINVGSTGGVEAARRGEADIAGVHLLNPTGDVYNKHLLDDSLQLIKGYRRTQGILFRKGDERFAGKSVQDILKLAASDHSIQMVNRNQGSGTRILIDNLLSEFDITNGYLFQPEVTTQSHPVFKMDRLTEIAIQGVVSPELEFIAIADEEYDFIIPIDRLGNQACRHSLDVQGEDLRQQLTMLGFSPA